MTGPIAGLIRLGAVVNSQACTASTLSVNSASAFHEGRWPLHRQGNDHDAVDEAAARFMRL
jgi:hypothetical protein